MGPGNQLKTVSRKQAVTTERQQKTNRFIHANIDSTEFPHQEWSKTMHIGLFLVAVVKTVIQVKHLQQE